MPTIVEMRQKRLSIWERMKEVYDRAEAEKRFMSAEEEANWRQANTELTELDRQIEIAEVMARTPASEEERRRIPGREGGGAQRGERTPTPDEYRAVFNRYLVLGRGELEPEERQLLRTGMITLSDAERRDLGVGNQAAAGYLVPEEYERNLIKNMLAFGGMREVATIRTTDTGADIPWPTVDDTGNTGELLAEHGTAANQDIAVARRILKAHMYSSRRINVSFQLLQDSAFDLPNLLAELLAERIARITNTHFTTGIGGNQPYGVITQAGTGVSAATGQTTTFIWDDLIQLEHSVDPAYRRNARFMMHDNTVSYAKRLKDGEGRYLWQPGSTVAGTPSTINGWPYIINQDVAQMAASARSIAFGDFSKYIIRDVRGFFLVRLDEVYAEQGEVAFVGFSRHDGMLMNAGTSPVNVYINAAS